MEDADQLSPSMPKCLEPTIIAHKGQTLNIIVYNELRNEEGISIHGMEYIKLVHQRLMVFHTLHNVPS